MTNHPNQQGCHFYTHTVLINDFFWFPEIRFSGSLGYLQPYSSMASKFMTRDRPFPVPMTLATPLGTFFTRTSWFRFTPFESADGWVLWSPHQWWHSNHLDISAFVLTGNFLPSEGMCVYSCQKAQDLSPPLSYLGSVFCMYPPLMYIKTLSQSFTCNTAFQKCHGLVADTLLCFSSCSHQLSGFLSNVKLLLVRAQCMRQNHRQHVRLVLFVLSPNLQYQMTQQPTVWIDYNSNPSLELNVKHRMGSQNGGNRNQVTLQSKGEEKKNILPSFQGAVPTSSSPTPSAHTHTCTPPPQLPAVSPWAI